MKSPTLVQKLVPTLYEDEHLLAVAKPAGVDAGGQTEGACRGLADTLAKLRGQGETLQVANRLSRHESGVLMLAKDPATLQHIRAEVKSNRVAREYLAVVLGSVAKSTLVIDPRHGASRGKRRPETAKGRSQRRPVTNARAVQADTPQPPAGRRRTVVEVLKRGKARTLIRCRTTVENTHALRAQLRAARLRLVGDPLHGTRRAPTAPESLCLHLTKIVLQHPGLTSKFSVSCRAPLGFTATADGGWELERPLVAALVRRLPGITGDGTESFRLLTGHAENLKGLVAEKYDNIVILQILEDYPKLTDALPAIARWYKRNLGVQAVYAKRFVKNRIGIDEETRGSLRSPQPLVGRPVPPEINITERGLSFVIRPYEGFSVGLFLDQRENRSRVRSLANGKEMLNLFAYTCGFSVAAAAGGARSTVSVDLSPKHLEWGRANFTLNGLDLGKHQFIKSDAADYIKRAGRQKKRFDLVIIDPPSFAHGRRSGRTFTLVKDLPGLVAGAASLLRAEGVMMISTNYRRLSLGGLRELVEKGAAGRRFQVTAAPGLPFDFAVDPDHAKTIFVRFPDPMD